MVRRLLSFWEGIFSGTGSLNHQQVNGWLSHEQWEFSYHDMFPRIGSTTKTPQLTILWWLMPRTTYACTPSHVHYISRGCLTWKRDVSWKSNQGVVCFFRGDIIQIHVLYISIYVMLDIFSQIPANCGDVFCRSKQVAEKKLVGGFNLIEKSTSPMEHHFSPFSGKITCLNLWNHHKK